VERFGRLEGMKGGVMTEADGARKRAEEHVKTVRDFLYHLMVFVFVNGLLVILDLRGEAGDGAVMGLDWAYWVILFWGLGLVGHAIYAFMGNHRVQREYEKERAREVANR
jgi:hypothetical protein